MDYIKAYKELKEAETKLIDVLNFIENKHSKFYGEDIERDKAAILIKDGVTDIINVVTSELKILSIKEMRDETFKRYEKWNLV